MGQCVAASREGFLTAVTILKSLLVSNFGDSGLIGQNEGCWKMGEALMDIMAADYGLMRQNNDVRVFSDKRKYKARKVLIQQEGE